MPSLPRGFEVFLTWLKEHDGRYYEFYRVYDPRGRARPMEGFWCRIGSEASGPGTIEALTFRDCEAALGEAAPSLAEFSSENLDPRRMDEWFARCPHVRLPVEEAHVPLPIEEAERPLHEVASWPWNYFGLRQAHGTWVVVSGYVPSEGKDDVDSAHAAAVLLGADHVVLVDADRRVLSVRDEEGQLVRARDEIRAIVRALESSSEVGSLRSSPAFS